jgi:hypothetical protein
MMAFNATMAMIAHAVDHLPHQHRDGGCADQHPDHQALELRHQYDEGRNRLALAQLIGTIGEQASGSFSRRQSAPEIRLERDGELGYRLVVLHVGPSR